jgi:hypothetical protein
MLTWAIASVTIALFFKMFFGSKKKLNDYCVWIIILQISHISMLVKKKWIQWLWRFQKDYLCNVTMLWMFNHLFLRKSLNILNDSWQKNYIINWVSNQWFTTIKIIRKRVNCKGLRFQWHSSLLASLW